MIYKSVRDVTDGMPKYIRAYGEAALYRFVWSCLALFHAGFKGPYSLSQSLPQFRQLLGAEDKEGDTENQEHVHGLKKTFKHS
jgi:hypothetical protein